MPVQTHPRPEAASATVESYHDTYREALQEATRRKCQPSLEGYITNVTRSAYGRFVVRSLPAEFVLDMALDGTPMPGFMSGFGFGGASFND
ncbi:hypothetical protein [Methylobacterium sp. E-005]|uniref:hypothetical protein n=1 Tax=Methylobacterium sp. E-005 TaxID=2836549 RepID=UPI001FBB1DE0|nr:hypothetical protein [Methylobacterium sp. E-005]